MKILGLSKGEAMKAVREGGVTLSVFGLGKIGLPLAAVFAEAGATVVGVDIRQEIVDAANRGENPIPQEPGLGELLSKNVRKGRLRFTTDGVEAARSADVHVIIVPTLLRKTGEGLQADLTPVFDSAKKIAEGMREGGIIITECTMPPGSTDSLEKFFSGKNHGLAHAPERVSSGTALRDITRQYVKIIGADNSATLEAVDGLYSAVNQKGVLRMSSIKAAECVKVFEGVYRDVNIALANELALVCDGLGVDALELFAAANTQPYSHIHNPGANVGGHCIPVYPYFIMSQKTKLIREARALNDSMPLHVVALAEKGLSEKGRTLSGSNILVLGLAFRGGVKEFANTAALPAINELKKRGANVFAFDPVCTESEAKAFGAEWFAGDYSSVDCIVVLTDHKEFKAYDWRVLSRKLRTPVVVDGRQVVDAAAVRSAGGVFKGIGRA